MLCRRHFLWDSCPVLFFIHTVCSDMWRAAAIIFHMRGWQKEMLAMLCWLCLFWTGSCCLLIGFWSVTHGGQNTWGQWSIAEGSWPQILGLETVFPPWDSVCAALSIDLNKTFKLYVSLLTYSACCSWLYWFWFVLLCCTRLCLKHMWGCGQLLYLCFFRYWNCGLVCCVPELHVLYFIFAYFAMIIV